MSDPEARTSKSRGFKDLAWDDFRLVKAVADARTLPAAAARLGVNHSTVFRRLGQVEAALGQPLFERGRTGYAPTAAGEAMLAVAGRLDEDVTAFVRAVAGREVSPAGELRLATSDTLLVHLLTPWLARFRARCPDIRLDVVVGNEALNLSKRDADVAVRASRRPPETLVGRRLGTIAWAVYGPASDEPGSGLEPGSASDWVGFGEALAGLPAARALAAEVAPERIVYRVSTVLGLAEAIAAGVGRGYLPCFVGDSRPDLARRSAPLPGLADELWLLTHPDLRRQPRVRAFLDFVGAEAAPLRDRLAGEGIG